MASRVGGAWPGLRAWRVALPGALPVRGLQDVDDVGEKVLGGTPGDGVAVDRQARRGLAWQLADEATESRPREAAPADVGESEAVVALEVGVDRLPVLVDEREEAGYSPALAPSSSPMMASRSAADPPAATNPR